MTSPSFRLVMRTGPTPGQTYDLVKNDIYIGRDITNDIVINDSEISRRHSRLLFQAGRYTIQDVGSTNGTFVNGQRLMGPHVLGVGEVVMLGENVSLSFESVGFDPNATVVGSAPQAGVPAPQGFAPPPAQPGFAPPSAQPGFAPPPAQPAYAPAPVYAGQVPAGPEEAMPPAPMPKKGGTNTWILAGCGCLFLVVIACVIAAFLIDYFNYWCTLFGFIIPGCP
ncbi:MAG: FHA domain-containing protein [Anaerolineales bacterium]|nr:FHA domain-containing protein [Anaerolineales bacterium]